MNTIYQPLNHLEQTEFADLLSGEFLINKGFGVYAFLTYEEIEDLYLQFLNKAVSAKTFVKNFVRSIR
jgi:hypothetical protein